jgi:hypothetical protein
VSTTDEVLAAARHLVQAFGRHDTAASHDVTTVIRTRPGEQTLTERETIVFLRDGDRWIAVHEHLSPQPGPDR